MRPKPGSRWSTDDGVTIVLVAFFIVAAMILGALAIDLSNARQERRQAQNAADAASLAAVAKLDGSGSQIANAVAAAKAYAKRNFDVDTTEWASCAGATPLSYTPAGESTCISFNSSSSPTQVRVTIPTKAIDTVFGNVAGLASINVKASATAEVGTPGAGKCVLCALGAGGIGFSQTGSGGITVTGGNVVTNATGTAISITHGDSFLVSPSISIVSGATISVQDPSQVPNLEQPGDAPTTDPLAAVAPAPPLGIVPPATPVASGLAQLTAVPPDLNAGGSQDITLNPGVWKQIKRTGCGKVILNPGIYVITDNMEFTQTPCAGNIPAANLVGDGVLLYFACAQTAAPYYKDTATNDKWGCADTGEGGATFKMSNNATISITPLTSGPYQGISIFYDRKNTSALSLTGGSSDAKSGAIYALSAEVTLTGSSTFTIGAAMIANNFKKTGSTSITINFDPSINPPLLGGSGGGTAQPHLIA